MYAGDRGMIVTKEEVQRIYRRRFSEADVRAKARVWKVLVEAFFQKWVRPTDTVVDLGCGYGEFLNYLKAARRIGVDLNPDSPAHLQNGIEFIEHSVCDLPFLADGSVDLVFTSNLMEHLPGKRDVEQMIREALRVLRPGGQFVMMGPNLRFLPGEYWDFWDHVVPITDRSLVEALENLGFEIAECHAKFLPYTTRSSLPQWALLVKVYLSVTPAWPILGKQFLVRARKPGQRQAGEVTGSGAPG
jgi:SAM-dependent methyltransferase